MVGSKEMFTEQRELEMQDEEPIQQHEQPQQIELNPNAIILLSKENAKAFHAKVKDRIKETGYGLFEYLETIKFFEKLKEVIGGNSQSKNEADREGDKEFRAMVRDEVAKWNGNYTSPRGVKFENAETGTKYDFSKCNDSEMEALESEMETISEKLKRRKEFLKSVPVEGLEILNADTGEVSRIYPPAKSSTSSYKITLPK